MFAHPCDAPAYSIGVEAGSCAAGPMPDFNFTEGLGGGPMRYDCKPATVFPECILFQYIEDVPEENGVCELDCRNHLCTEREWIICRHRLSRAAGELIAHGQANA
jgi:hypothetical protein